MPRSDAKQSFKLESAYGYRMPESGSGEAVAFKWRDDNHTPWSSTKPGAIALLSVQVGGGPKKGDEWASIRLEEIVADKNGNKRGRTISVSLDAEARAALIAYLQSDGEA